MLEFLISHYGEELGRELFRRQQERLKELARSIEGKKQSRTLVKNILPSIALHLVLTDELGSKEASSEVLEDYLRRIGEKLGNLYRKAERVPLFFQIFRFVFSLIVLKSGSWDAQIVINNRFALEIDISKCLWHDSCAENGCPELCSLFCSTDDIIYGALEKTAFFRSGSLGFGQSACDFKFKKQRLVRLISGGRDIRKGGRSAAQGQRLLHKLRKRSP
ncbi:MAG: L-2-amino-thiazoline-4-carboxylic acid hydrolase [Clostridiales bacterium]|jgi:hypothetical protein|nr:L-2-amino-thiazoline-4-carboxylic acid hydrolase [Clostridiales bacterium]